MVQLSHMRSEADFKNRVRAVVSAIPCGETMSYKEVASQAGNPNAARAVGAIMRAQYDPDIPCHRVIHADGCAGGYNRTPARKRALLRQEGAIFTS